MSAFLDPEEVAELTGIRRGKAGQSRHSLQAQALERMGVPHVINAAGRPVVPRNFLERRPIRSSAWEPKLPHSAELRGQPTRGENHE